MLNPSSQIWQNLGGDDANLSFILFSILKLLAYHTSFLLYH